jgi:hypothetical protein
MLHLECLATGYLCFTQLIRLSHTCTALSQSDRRMSDEARYVLDRRRAVAEVGRLCLVLFSACT